MIKIVLLMSFCISLYAKNYMQEIEKLKLYENKDWQRMLYYKEQRGATESYMINDEFFVSKNGKTNPKDEMIQSVLLLLKDDIFKKKFPLRYKFLNKHLLFDLSQMDEKKYKKIYLVFPNVFTKAAASMFGHLYIVLEDDTFINADVVHFGAISQNATGLEYLYRGLAGGFDAHYLNEKNYIKLKEYSVMESRDIYLYELKLTPDELNDYALHIQELKHARTKYYFMDENCAFFLAKSLEVVLKEDLSEDFFVLPSDVINALIEKNKVNESYMKEADISVFDKKYQLLSSEDKKQVIELIKNKDIKNLPNDEILEVFLDISTYMIYNYSTYYESVRINRIRALKRLQEKNNTYAENKFKALKTEKIKAQEIRFNNNFNGKYEFYYRPMYYSKLNNIGNIYDIKVEALSVEYLKSTDDILKLNIFDLKSFIPYTEVLNNISWKTKFSIMRFINEQSNGYAFEIAAGYSHNFFNKFLLHELIGFSTGNFDDILNNEVNTYYSLLIEAGIKYNINLHNELDMSYEYKYNKNLIRAQYTNKINSTFGFHVKYENFENENLFQIGVSSIF